MIIMMLICDYSLGLAESLILILWWRIFKKKNFVVNLWWDARQLYQMSVSMITMMMVMMIVTRNSVSNNDDVDVFVCVCVCLELQSEMDYSSIFFLLYWKSWDFSDNIFTPIHLETNTYTHKKTQILLFFYR